ncbi:hypothetical protein RFI_20060 [Reticulomyxa filosa]|uniref:Uncharacterized protein n=1 Tax=Reticulomyxa filosa TaxID=46433 RepID=X6MVZ0_RETFI|nr:hypothetical protein RFI_20060 [Reticulomyxa filosa]|eukprot:ETO17270.1 hypothetical protein RFI_20060 [Reticulomyxa filosa]
MGLFIGSGLGKCYLELQKLDHSFSEQMLGKNSISKLVNLSDDVKGVLLDTNENGNLKQFFFFFNVCVFATPFLVVNIVQHCKLKKKKKKKKNKKKDIQQQNRQASSETLKHYIVSQFFFYNFISERKKKKGREEVERNKTKQNKTKKKNIYTYICKMADLESAIDVTKKEECLYLSQQVDKWQKDVKKRILVLNEAISSLHTALEELDESQFAGLCYHIFFMFRHTKKGGAFIYIVFFDI